MTLAVNRTATYYAVLVVGGVVTAQSASVDVVVEPALKLTAVRVIGPVYHFNATVMPAVDGMPVVLQRLVGKRWKTIEKDLTDDGEFTCQRRDPGERGLEVAGVRPRIHEVRRVDLEGRAGHRPSRVRAR